MTPISLQQLDSLIIGLNKIAEGATRTAQTVETIATDLFPDGVKPVTAARLQEPTLEEACREYAAEEGTAYPTTIEPDTSVATPLSAGEAAATVVSLPELRSLLSDLSQAGHTAEVRELITQAGANTLSEVDPTQYAGIYQKAKEIADG